MLGMLKNVVGNLLAKPATRLHPQIKREAFFAAQGSLVLEAARCDSCGLCHQVCPCQCIKVGGEEVMWRLDPYRCVLCGACLRICPPQAIKMSTAYWPPGKRGIISLRPGAKAEES